MKWNGKQQEVQMYYPDGNLHVLQKVFVKPDYFSKDPICCGSMDFMVDEYIVYDENGDTASYTNFNKGVFDGRPSFSSSKKIAALQSKADALLKANMGEAFFSKYIRPYYGNMNITWNTDAIRAMQPPLTRGTLPPDEMILDIQFSYLLYLSESEQYNLIHVQFDEKGNVVYKIDNGKNCLTNGLVSAAANSFISPAEALQLAGSTIKNKTDVYIDLIWKEDVAADCKGTYYYQILFNKSSKSESSSAAVFFDELLINAATKQQLPLQKYSVKIEAIGNTDAVSK